MVRTGIKNLKKKYEYDKSGMQFGHSSAIHDIDVIKHIEQFSPNFHDVLPLS